MESKLKEGETLFADGNIEEAEKCFLAVIENDSDNKVAYNNLGVIATEKMDVKGANEYFIKSLEIDPFYKKAVVNYADLLKALDLQQTAIPLLEKFIEIDPEDTEIKELLEDISSGLKPEQKSHKVVLSENEILN